MKRQMFVRVRVCACVWVHECMSPCGCMCMCACVSVYLYVRMCMCMLEFKYVCVCVFVFGVHVTRALACSRAKMWMTKCNECDHWKMTSSQTLDLRYLITASPHAYVSFPKSFTVTKSRLKLWKECLCCHHLALPKQNSNKTTAMAIVLPDNGME